MALDSHRNLKRIGVNAIVYSGGNIAVKIVSFLFIPLYTHYLSPFEVGIVYLLELLELLYFFVAPLGTMNGLVRFYYLAKKEGKEKRFVASNYGFMIIANTVFLGVGLVAASQTARYFLSSPDYTGLVQIFVVSLFLGLSRQFVLTVLRICEKAVSFVLLILTNFVILVSITIIFVINMQLGIWGIIYAKLITASVVCIFATIYIGTRFGFALDFREIRRTLRYGIPLVFHSVSLLVISMSDHYFVKRLISVEAVGVYAIAYKFGMIMNMVLVTPFVQAWQPILFQLENQPDQKSTYRNVALHFVQVGILAWLSVSIMSKYVLKLATTDNYHYGLAVIPWIAFSYLFYGLQNIFQAGALIHNKTLMITGISAFSACVNVALNIFLIPRWGLLGAGVATAVSYLIMMLLVLGLSQKLLYIDWLWRKMLLVMGLGLAIYCVSLINPHNPHLAFAKDTAVVILLPVLMIVFKLVSVDEVRRFVREMRSGARVEGER